MQGDRTISPVYVTCLRVSEGNAHIEAQRPDGCAVAQAATPGQVGRGEVEGGGRLHIAAVYEQRSAQRTEQREPDLDAGFPQALTAQRLVTLFGVGVV